MPAGTVKFFNETKGFGFISPEEGGPDVFVHVSALERAGVHGLSEGQTVSYELEQDRRSGKLAAVDIQVTGGGSGGGGFSSRPPRGDFGGRGGGGDFNRGPRPAPRAGGGGFGGEPAGSGTGVVKWFNATKGFGFIQPDGGGEDVFVHVSAVESAGLRGLDEGRQIAYDLQRDPRKGKTSAVNLRLLG